jgi:magnesium transporter
MNERQEKTSDILGKLTVMGTIVLPMNVVTGIWGMNCEYCFLFILVSSH